MIKALTAVFVMSVAAGLTVFGIITWIQKDRTERQEIRAHYKAKIVRARDNVASYFKHLTSAPEEKLRAA